MNDGTYLRAVMLRDLKRAVHGSMPAALKESYRMASDAWKDAPLAMMPFAESG